MQVNDFKWYPVDGVNVTVVVPPYANAPVDELNVTLEPVYVVLYAWIEVIVHVVSLRFPLLLIVKVWVPVFPLP